MSLKTFIIYARDDKSHKDLLLRHLRPLVISSVISIWHDGDILPGEDWEKVIKKNIQSSDLILVLVSVNSLNSDFIQTEELSEALNHFKGKLSKIIPIIVDPCMWSLHPVFKGLQGLPDDMRPVSTWNNVHEAWTNVVSRLHDMILHIIKDSDRQWQELEDNRKRTENEQQDQVKLEEDRKYTEEEQQQLATLRVAKGKESSEQSEDLKEKTNHPNKDKPSNNRIIAWFIAFILIVTLVYIVSNQFFRADGKIMSDIKVEPDTIVPINVPKYDYYDIYYCQNRKIVIKDSLYGFIDTDSNEIIEPKYQKVHIFNEGRAAIKHNGLWGFIDLAGNEVIKANFDSVENFSNGRAAVLKNGLWGFIGLNNLMIIAPQYLNVRSFYRGHSCVQNKIGFWGIIDTIGAVKLNHEFDGLTDFPRTRLPGGYAPIVAVVKKLGSYYLLNHNYKIISKGYSCIKRLSSYQDLILVWNNVNILSEEPLFGLIDMTGKEIIQPKYNRIITPSFDTKNINTKNEDLFYFSKNRVPTLDVLQPSNIDKYYDNILPSIREVSGSYRTNESIIVEQNNKFGLFTLQGSLIKSPAYIDVYDFQSGLARVREDDYWKIINFKGKDISAFKYDEIRPFKEGIAAVRNDSLWGYIDIRGRKTIESKYFDAGDFKNDTARVVIEEKKASNKLKKDYNEYVAKLHKRFPALYFLESPQKRKIQYYIDKKGSFVKF